MDTLTLGPLALPLDRLPGIAALAALLLAAALLSRGHPRLRAWSTEATLVTLVAARAGFVAVNWPAYAPQPLSALSFWQGGFLPLAGAAMVLPYTFWRLRGEPEALLRAGIPLAAAAGVFLAVGFGADWLKPQARPLPQLTVQTLNGGREDLRSHLGNPVVVNLWASWCPPCRREMPMLVDLAESQRDVTVLLLNQGESRQQVRQYLEEVGLPGQAVRLDPESRASRRLGVEAFPTSLVYDGRGRLVSRRAGEVSRAVVESAIIEARRAGQ